MCDKYDYCSDYVTLCHIESKLSQLTRITATDGRVMVELQPIKQIVEDLFKGHEMGQYV
jgi:hypothetical protein